MASPEGPVVGRFEWPKDVLLYHTPPARELLPDRAKRLMFESYLTLAGLSYTEQITLNADFMSPSGKSPFLVINFGAMPVIFDDIFQLVKFLKGQKLALEVDLDKKEHADCEAFISLVKTSILPAMEYIAWVSSSSLKDTLRSYGYGLPWPLSHIVPCTQYIRHYWNHWDMHREEHKVVEERFKDACHALSVRLGKNESFFQSGPTLLDAVVYGCIEAIIDTNTPLVGVLSAYKNLNQFCQVSVFSQRKGLQFITSPSSATLVSSSH